MFKCKSTFIFTNFLVYIQTNDIVQHSTNLEIILNKYFFFVYRLEILIMLTERNNDENRLYFADFSHFGWMSP